MAKLFLVTVATGSKTVAVVADDAEVAKTKVTLSDGETLVSVEDKGEVVV